MPNVTELAIKLKFHDSSVDSSDHFLPLCCEAFDFVPQFHKIKEARNLKVPLPHAVYWEKQAPVKPPELPKVPS